MKKVKGKETKIITHKKEKQQELGKEKRRMMSDSKQFAQYRERDKV